MSVPAAPRTRPLRVDVLAALGLAISAAQCIALSAPVTTSWSLDVISLGMTALAALCWWRTWQVAASVAMAQRWRWRAATAGWLLWTIQWGANTVEVAILAGDQRVANLLVLAHRVAFIVALVPIAPPDDPRLFSWLDAMLGLVFASLLTVLAWPGLPDGVAGDPDRAYLYLGYVAMAALAGVSLIAQRAAAMRRLPRALFWTLAGYGATGIVMRELYRAGMIAHDSPVFLLGNLAFVAYLALLPARGPAAAPPADAPDTIVAARLVPLLLAALIIALAFVVARTAPAAGFVTALAAFAVYAARATLAENLHHAAQRARLAAMVDMMHEIRSPLGAVALNVGLLRRRATLDEREQRICAAIDSGCANVVTLLEDVLSLERLEAGLVPPAIATHDLAAIARDTAALLEAMWGAAGVAVHCPQAPFPASVDRAAVQRILLNLIGNAVRFTPGGGAVDVSFAHARDGAVVMGVRDTGTGMSAETCARLFQRFATVGQPLYGVRGTGLGLSISLALARTMGGTIRVDSREGAGTLVEVVIPQRLAEQ